jgi:hypothetical protein
MLRTAQLLPPKGLSTLGFDPTRFQTEPPACYRASWQLPGPDLHRQVTTSLSLSAQPNGITSNSLDARTFRVRAAAAGLTLLLGIHGRIIWQIEA